MAEVASAFVTLVPSAKGFGAKTSAAIGGDMDRAGREGGKRFGGGLVASAKGFAGPLAAAFGAAAVVDFFKGAVTGASDLAESGTKINQIFGAGAGSVQKFAQQGAKALGQTQLEVLNAAGTFGTFGKAAGLGGKDLAKFSTDFAGLSTDLASFNNTSPEEAVEAIGAALRGEAEPIRKFGVLLDDATLRNEALRLGLIKSTKTALTPQQKVLAAQAAIYKQTGDAQGDFQRTSGGLANQQRILSAQFSDFKTTLGTALLPIVTKFVTFLNNGLVPGFQRLGKFLAPLRPIFDNIALGFNALLYGFQFGEVATDGFAGKLMQFGKDAAAAFQLFVGYIKTNLVPAITGVVTAFRTYLSVIIPIVQQFTAGLIARIRPMLPTIRAVFVQIGQIIVQVMGLVQAIISRVTAIVSAIWSRWGSQILSVITFIFGTVLKVIKGALNIIQGIIRTVTAVIKGDWSGAWEGIKQIVTGALQVIKAVISGALGAIKGLWSAGWSALKEIVSTGFSRVNSAIVSGIGSAVGLVRDLPGKIVSAMGDLGGILFGAGQRLIQGLIDGIGSKIQAVRDKAGQLAQTVKDFFPGSPVKRGPLRSWNGPGPGAQLGDRLAAGLLASQSTVADASSAMASQVKGGSVAYAASGSGYGAATVGSSYQIYGPDAAEVARRIQENERRIKGTQLALTGRG